MKSEPNKTLYCPCHGSTFDEDGKVTSSPARRDLPVHEVTKDETGNLLVRVPSR